MLNKIIKKITISLGLSIIFAVIGYLIAFPIANYYQANFKDVMFIEGLVIILITILFSIAGNPSGFTFQKFRDKTWQNIEYKDLETTRMERESSNYLNRFTSHPIVRLTFNSLTIILGGVFIILFSMFLV